MIRKNKKEIFSFYIVFLETFKPTTVLNIEQQRERERQRVREEEERRRKVLMRKDHQQPAPITLIPKFEQLIVDTHNDELSKSKTPISGKPATVTPLPRLSQHEENDSLLPKKFLIKKRSTILVSLFVSISSFQVKSFLFL